MEFAEVGESLAARAMWQFGFPFADSSIPGRFALRFDCFSGLPFGGVKIRLAVMGHRWYPGGTIGAWCEWKGWHVGWNAGAEGFVHVGGEDGRVQLMMAGEGEVRVYRWEGGVAVTAAGGEVVRLVG